MDLSQRFETLFYRSAVALENPVVLVEGKIPDEVSGTYYLNGPAGFARNEFRYSHWLDGDGLVRALTLRSGEASLRARWVGTEKRQVEDREDRPLFRTFGNRFEGDRVRDKVRLETPANVSLYPFGDQMLAYGEQSYPYALSPESLETRGEFRWDLPDADLPPLSAHPKVLEERGEVCNFGLNYGVRENRLDVLRFKPGEGLVGRRSVPLKSPFYLHDFAVSSRFAAFHCSPYVLRVTRLLFGQESLDQALRWDPAKSASLLLVPRSSEEPLLQVETRAGEYCLHLINAFDSDEEGQSITVDYIATTEPVYPQYRSVSQLFESVKPGVCRRARIDCSKGTLELSETPLDGHVEFPSIRDGSSAQDYEGFWALRLTDTAEPRAKFFDELIRFSWKEAGVVDRYVAPEGTFLSGEPSHISGRDSEGYVICQCWNAEAMKSGYVLFRAMDLAAGPIARIELANLDPLAFHSCFVPLRDVG